MSPPRSLCARPSAARRADRSATSYATLSMHQTVTLGYQSSGQPLRWPFRIGGKVIEIVPPSMPTTDTGEALIAMVAAGTGIGTGSPFVTAPLVARGELAPVLGDFAVERDKVAAIWSESRRTNPAVRAALGMLQEAFRHRS